MSRLTIKKYDNYPQYGIWGVWTYGDEQGTFGRNRKGMWAQLNGNVFFGLETYEQDLTDKFKKSLIDWRKFNQAFRTYLKRDELLKGG